MKILTFIVFTVFLSISLNAESILHLGIGMGQFGGATVEPYKETTSTTNGINFTIEYEKYIYNFQSISFFSKYSNYDKLSKWIDKSNSNSINFGMAYNITNTFSSKLLLVQVSSLLSYGIEKIAWQVVVADPNWSGVYYNEKLEDFIGYVSFGFIGGIGIKTDNVVTKLNLSVVNDYLIHDERTNLTNNVDYIELNDLDYETVLYMQVRLSIGYIF